MTSMLAQGRRGEEKNKSGKGDAMLPQVGTFDLKVQTAWSRETIWPRIGLVSHACGLSFGGLRVRATRAAFDAGDEKGDGA